MKKGEFMDKFEEIPDHFVRWGFIAYLFGGLLKILLIFPFIVIMIFWNIFGEEYENYQKKRQSQSRIKEQETEK